MTRMDLFPPGETITVAPIKTFPLIRDLVTDVSYNYEKAKQIPAFEPRPPRPDGTYRMMQEDIDRGQEFHKCIECFLCQDVCHVIRDHEENKPAVRRAALLRQAGRARDAPAGHRRTAGSSSASAAGIGFCNITKCCTEVCPEHIQITDNAIIPLKERVVDDHYDPIVWLLGLGSSAAGRTGRLRGDRDAGDEIPLVRHEESTSTRPRRSCASSACPCRGATSPRRRPGRGGRAARRPGRREGPGPRRRPRQGRRRSSWPTIPPAPRRAQPDPRHAAQDAADAARGHPGPLGPRRGGLGDRARALPRGHAGPRPGAHVVMASQAGGMDIEEVAAAHPRRSSASGRTRRWASRASRRARLAFGLGLAGDQFKAGVALIRGALPRLPRQGLLAGRDQPAGRHAGRPRAGARRQAQLRRQRALPAPGGRRAARRQRGRPARRRGARSTA